MPAGEDVLLGTIRLQAPEQRRGRGEGALCPETERV